jgi:hypothetical protein
VRSFQRTLAQLLREHESMNFGCAAQHWAAEASWDWGRRSRWQLRRERGRWEQLCPQPCGERIKRAGWDVWGEQPPARPSAIRGSQG